MWLHLLLACTGLDNRADSLPGDSGDSAVEGCASHAATVEIGGGAITFEPATDGADLTMVHGPQGGWHVLGSARLRYVNPIVSIHYTVEVLPEGSLIADNTYRVQILEDDPCGGYYPGMYGYLDVRALADGDLDTPPELLAGRDLLLRMDITDLDGRVATDTLSAVAALDPMDVEP